MVAVTQLLLPIGLSAVFVFIASSVIHMALGYHAQDFRALPDERGVMDALRPFSLPAGDYAAPKPAGMADMKSPGFIEKRTKGPVFSLTIMKAGPADMGGKLLGWFVYCLVLNFCCGYLAGVTLPAGADYLRVFRVVSTVAFMGYVAAWWQDVIWMERSRGTALRNTLDGLIYSFVTAGTFGWLWPR